MCWVVPQPTQDRGPDWGTALNRLVPVGVLFDRVPFAYHCKLQQFGVKTERPPFPGRESSSSSQRLGDWKGPSFDKMFLALAPIFVVRWQMVVIPGV